MKKLSFLLVSACALLTASLEASALPSVQALQACPAPPVVAELLPSGRDWILKSADNICGLRDPNQLTYPAVIDFDTCLDATPEMRRVRDQGIDPQSAEGIQLRSKAVTRLTNACESVRGTNGHCSVWKEIRHKDGRSIPDISSQVIALF
jgi:hypothetical protein